jgi:taurine dioxygenase
MLYSIEVPSRGGNTLFANMSAAYDDLAESMKRRIDPLVVLHHYGNRDDLDEDSRTAASKLTAEQKDKVSWVRHAVHALPLPPRQDLFSGHGFRSRCARLRHGRRQRFCLVSPTTSVDGCAVSATRDLLDT